MAPTAKGKSPPSSRKRAAAPESARLVVDEEGRIVYASAAFAALVKQAPHRLQGQALTTLLAFAEPQAARESDTPDSLTREGCPRVLFSGDNPALLQFDRITDRHGRRYAIGAAVENPGTKIHDGRFNSFLMR